MEAPSGWAVRLHTKYTTNGCIYKARAAWRMMSGDLGQLSIDQLIDRILSLDMQLEFQMQRLEAANIARSRTGLLRPSDEMLANPGILCDQIRNELIVCALALALAVRSARDRHDARLGEGDAKPSPPPP